MNENNTLFEEKLPEEENIEEVVETAETIEPVEEPEVIEPTDEIDTIEPEEEIELPDPVIESPEEDEMLEEFKAMPVSDVPECEKPYHERYYLQYKGKAKTELDLKNTRQFLKELGFDGGELRQARKGEFFSESYKNAEENKNKQMYCSYCGTEISGVEFYRLPDGRIRCTSCSNSLVKTKEEASAICKRVAENLDIFFHASINVPVAIEILDERKLKKKSGCSIGERDDKSVLILGVAINKKKEYSILLENGAPRISLISTFAHELTHIWQYTHWDTDKNMKKCPAGKRLLIYEGMAKWVEIQYLYLIGETDVARREEEFTRAREDEYGKGFRIYEDRYPLSREVMTCDNTPFVTGEYPID